MSLSDALIKFERLAQGVEFSEYGKKLADLLTSSLAVGYSNGLPEPDLVKIIDNVSKQVGVLDARRGGGIEMRTRTAFVHGNKSQVEFSFYGNVVQRELGDLLFIISLVFKGKKFFEKVTINQFKKGKSQTSQFFWDLGNKEQLFLLSRFPTFRGVKRSLVLKKYHNLQNLSVCLGSYGFLRSPGDFGFISATMLDSFLVERNRLTSSDLAALVSSPSTSALLPIVYHNLYRFRWYAPTSLFMNQQSARNVHEFVQRFLSLSIGEPTFMAIGEENAQARALVRDLFSAARMKGKQSNDKTLVGFCDDFLQRPYATDGNEETNSQPELDFDGGGLGIVYTTINLGEE